MHFTIDLPGKALRSLVQYPFKHRLFPTIGDTLVLASAANAGVLSASSF